MSMMPATGASYSGGSFFAVVDSKTLEQGDGESGGLEGRVLADRYRVENVVASGANTIIAEAIDIESELPVTVKVVRPELATTDGFLRSFRRQAEVATALTHPNIATVLDWGETDLDGESTVFWVVEYLGGGSLRDLFDRGRLLEPSQALVVGLEACRALGAAHTRGIVHTELTPSKLVFGADGRLRIVDFAMASLLGAQAWSEPATVATHVVRYASPEQALGMAVDAKTDVYALSLCLIEATTGSVPFAGDSTVSTLAARVGKLMPVSADLGSLASVLERAGRPDADDRSTADEFGQGLVQAAETLPRPEPLPLLEASLFGAAVAGVAAQSVDVEVGLDAPGKDSDLDVDSDSDSAGDDAGMLEDGDPLDDSAGDEAEASADDTSEQLESELVEPDQLESDQSDSAEPESDETEPNEFEVAEAAAAPLILMTDIADPPTGAVQVAEGTSDGVDTALESAAPTVPVATQQFDQVDPTPPGAIFDDERNNNRWSKIALIGLVALVGIVALSYAGWLLIRTKSYEVPDLVGIEETVAQNEIAGNGWTVEVERLRSDEVPEMDHVVRTTPVAGEQLDEGEVFVLYVSDGPEFRTLPDVTGSTLEEAQEVLADLSLLVIELPREFSETVPAGSIISWQVLDDASLTAGAQVLPDTTIELVVSDGPQPRPAPALVNLNLEEATAATDALQLVIAQGDDVFSGQIEVGRVVIQTPAPDTPVQRGGTVTVQLSKGPDLLPIPDLAGMTYPQAEQTLADAGFGVNSLLGTTEGTFVSISVDGENVQPGDLFPRDTGVDLIFL